MSEKTGIDQTCIIIGASHAGVNCAFALRKEGWQGRIEVYDQDPHLPYHRPPLSKAYLSGEEELDQHLLRKAESYEKDQIDLHLGTKVESIDREHRHIVLQDGSIRSYDKLVIATGARPWMPPIPGIDTTPNVFPLRTLTDAMQIQEAFHASKQKRVLIIGGGYIGLETAASLRKLGAEVVVLERENRLLARVCPPILSDFFQQLHQEQGVEICTGKEVVSIALNQESQEVICADGSQYVADLIVVGTGISVNLELAQDAGLEMENGILVDEHTRTSDPNIFAIGDCSSFRHPRYSRLVRLESVQNAVDQASIAAAAICGEPKIYDAVPWFWSDQYDVKLQMVGLSEGADEVLLRKEKGTETQFSLWYFQGENLLAVDAINHARAYMFGTKLIKNGKRINKTNLVNPDIAFKPATLLHT